MLTKQFVSIFLQFVLHNSTFVHNNLQQHTMIVGVHLDDFQLININQRNNKNNNCWRRNWKKKSVEIKSTSACQACLNRLKIRCEVSSRLEKIENKPTSEHYSLNSKFKINKTSRKVFSLLKMKFYFKKSIIWLRMLYL